MKNVLLVLLLAVLCTGMGSKPVVQSPAPKPIHFFPSVTGPMLIIKGCTNCTQKEIEFIRKAEVKMNEVVVGQCFQDQLAKVPLIQTKGLTPKAVVESLIHAGIEIDVTMYYTSKRVLGYTIDGVNKEWINRRYMLSWNICDLGSLLTHETSHKVGYDHSYYPNSTRKYSVPYASNTAFDSCCH